MHVLINKHNAEETGSLVGRKWDGSCGVNCELNSTKFLNRVKWPHYLRCLQQSSVLGLQQSLCVLRLRLTWWWPSLLFVHILKTTPCRCNRYSMVSTVRFHFIGELGYQRVFIIFLKVVILNRPPIFFPTVLPFKLFLMTSLCLKHVSKDGVSFFIVYSLCLLLTRLTISRINKKNQLYLNLKHIGS